MALNRRQVFSHGVVVPDHVTLQGINARRVIREKAIFSQKERQEATERPSTRERHFSEHAEFVYRKNRYQ